MDSGFLGREEVALAKQGSLTEHGFAFRPGTNDEGIFQSVMQHDEYHLPSSFRSDDIILDVGMHIGSFCYKALLLGSNHVYGFEAERSNYECAVSNLKPFGNRVHLYQKAVWRSDRVGDKLFYSSSTDELNRGGGNVIWGTSGQEVPMIGLDEVLKQVTKGGKRRVRMLKIDCEGSEFPILLTSRLLHLIDEIAGEYHEYGGNFTEIPISERAGVEGYDEFSIQELSKALQKKGFRVTSMAHPNTNLGLFHAVNESKRLPMQEILKRQVRSTWYSISKRLKAS